MRSVWPSVIGLSPMPALRIAFSTAITMALSQTFTVIIRGSGTLMAPTWFSGMLEP